MKKIYFFLLKIRDHVTIINLKLKKLLLRCVCVWCHHHVIIITILSTLLIHYFDWFRFDNDNRWWWWFPRCLVYRQFKRFFFFFLLYSNRYNCDENVLIVSNKSWFVWFHNNISYWFTKYIQWMCLWNSVKFGRVLIWYFFVFKNIFFVLM